MDKPLVSVVIPVYNVEKYLKECLDSVINQTLRELEIICVDDGSTDSSLSILKEYEAKDIRIKVITKENSGYGNTMNIGTYAATGEYVGIVESDDYVEKNMFKLLYDTAKKFDADIVKSDHYTFSTRNGIQNKEYHATCTNARYYGKVLNVKQNEEIYDFVMMNWTGIYKKDFLIKHSIKYNETPGASFQDNGFWFQTITMASRIVFINEAFYYYRQDNPNSSINNKKKIYCICDEFEYIYKFLESKPDLYDKHIITYVKKKFFNYRNSFNRISDEYKLDFLYREQEEYKKDLRLLGNKKKNLDPWIMGEMSRIVDSPELYLYEENKSQLNNEAREIHEVWEKLITSKEFQKGLLIKKRLHI